jgi:hypothetical protein
MKKSVVLITLIVALLSIGARISFFNAAPATALAAGSELTLNTSVATKTENFNASAVYYVAAGGGDKAGNGGAANPFKTVKFALETLFAANPAGGCQITVKDGDYDACGYINSIRFENPILIKAERQYKVRVKGSSHRTMYMTNSKNIIISGFEFVGNANDKTLAYLMQIELSENIVLENNIIHDSYNNDLLKLNERCDGCEIRNNIFYNQNTGGGDEHIDANGVYNTTIEGNIFFNDYEASGRTASNAGFYFILFKSSSSTDITTASRTAVVRKNVFLNWWGAADASYIGLGEDGKSFYEMRDIEISDNLFINNDTTAAGNFRNRMAGLLTVKNAKNVVFKNNISNGFVQHSANADNAAGGFGYAVRLSKEGTNPEPLDNVQIINNSFADYSGRMGMIAAGTSAMITNVTADGNNYFNNGKEFLNVQGADLALRIAYDPRISSDRHAYFGDPKLESDLSAVPIPYFLDGKIHGGYADIASARLDLIRRYGGGVAPDPYKMPVWLIVFIVIVVLLGALAIAVFVLYNHKHGGGGMPKTAAKKGTVRTTTAKR